MTVYVETSALLASLLGEPHGDAVKVAIDGAERVVTSVLTLMEARRALWRLENAGRLKSAEASRLAGGLRDLEARWTILDLTPGVRDRVTARFPLEPIRTLDALHLASALELIALYQDLSVLSLDQRIIENLEPLGLRPSHACHA